MHGVFNLRHAGTVVPALGDPRRERPPDVYGHVIKVPTHLNVTLPIGGHLPNAYADSHLLVVRTCYNGQCKPMPRFRWSIQPKIARGAHPNLRPTVCSNVHAAIWWPQAMFHIESKFLRDEPRDCGNSDHFVTSVLRHYVVKVTYSMLNQRCWRRERFLVLTNAPYVECLSSSWCGKTQIARIEANRGGGHKGPSWPSGIRAAGLKWNTLSAKSWLTLTTTYKCSRTVQYLSCYIIMMH